MANELQNLSQIFQNRLFRIPDYQRGYAWQQAQLIDFWDDLVNLQKNRFHYTGLLSLKILSEKEAASWGNDLWITEKGYKPCHIVDGQQRLTTFIILVNELVNFVRTIPENNGKSDEEIILGYDTLKDIVSKYIYQKRPPHNMITTYLFGYENDNPSAEYLRYKVFGEPYSGTVCETYYTKNLRFAKNFFADNLNSFYTEEGIDGINFIYRKLTQNLMFNIHEIADDYDVFVAFETMNNRGKKLTNLELLKNRLIYLTTLYEDKPFDEKDKAELRKQINDAWKEVYYRLGMNKDTPLSDDDFLRAHWILYFAYSRKKGDDYIKFLLNFFSAKKIFEKKPVLLHEETTAFSVVDLDEDETTDNDEHEIGLVSKLEPEEIKNYVNSLKDLAKYWYDTFFPYESPVLTNDEKLWVDRLNRIGIANFRPLIASVISIHTETTPEDRINVFKAIERFIFVCFRLGVYNTSYCSSEYYKAARQIIKGEMTLKALSENINTVVNENVQYAVQAFTTRVEKRFNSGDGYYGWNTLRYFMYEYEYTLSVINNLQKITWELFTKSEKDKVSIEHILPQTPTKHYWKNQFRQFTDVEIQQLTGALGNLLPLSQSINSSLQNQSFTEKKTTTQGRRGYQNGSHSEIEVSQKADWSAENIYERSVMLVEFMIKRWNIKLDQEQIDKLVYINFVNDGRVVPPELPEPVVTISTDDELEEQQRHFWTKFVDFCKDSNRLDIGSRKGLAQNWYEIPVGSPGFQIQFTITKKKYVSLVIYAFDRETFNMIESKKDVIESVFGSNLNWYSSRKNSVAKRIIYKMESDYFNEENHPEIFNWMVEHFDKLVKALNSAEII